MALQPRHARIGGGDAHRGVSIDVDGNRSQRLLVEREPSGVRSREGLRLCLVATGTVAEWCGSHRGPALSPLRAVRQAVVEERSVWVIPATPRTIVVVLLQDAEACAIGPLCEVGGRLRRDRRSGVCSYQYWPVRAAHPWRGFERFL